MRRTEAHQGVRMIQVSSILSRYEAAEFSQAEAAELLGIGERTFRRWPCWAYLCRISRAAWRSSRGPASGTAG